MFTKRINTVWVLGIAMAFVVSLGASSASATPIDTATFQLTSDHCTGTGGCLDSQTSGGTVTVTDNGGGSLSFNITLSNNNQFVNGGFPVSFGFNLDSIAQITYSGLSTGWTIPDEIPANKQNASSYHMDGTGFFGFGVEWGGGPGGSTPDPGPLVFDISATGLTLASLTTNAAGEYMAADIISGTTGNTGAVDASPVSTPEASTSLLLSIALIGVAIVGRKMAAARA